jgi:broad specificity phosphatase PhoE
MILIRHGQSEFNVVYGATRRDPGIPDPRLTADGRRQAAAVGRELAALGIARLLVSPYTRAIETAEIATGVHPVPVRIEPLVRERAAFTCDVGASRSELTKRWPHHDFDHIDEVWWAEFEESENALHARAAAFRAATAASDGWRDTAVVTHWGFIRALTGLPVPNGAMVRFDPTGEAAPTVLEPASES